MIIPKAPSACMLRCFLNSIPNGDARFSITFSWYEVNSLFIFTTRLPFPLWHLSFNGQPSQFSHWYFSIVLLSMLPDIAISLSLINLLLFGHIIFPSSSFLKLMLLKISSWNFLSCVSLFHKGNFMYISILFLSQYLYVSKFPYPASATG